MHFGRDWHLASFRCPGEIRSLSAAKRASAGGAEMSARDPERTSNKALLDHLVGAAQHDWRNGKLHRPCGLEVDHKLVLSSRLDWQVSRPLAFKDAVNVTGRKPPGRRNQAHMRSVAMTQRPTIPSNRPKSKPRGNAANHPIAGTKLCERCGTEFAYRRRTARWCSVRCRVYACRVRREPRP